MNKTLPTPVIVKHGVNGSIGRSKDVGPRRMDVHTGLKEALGRQGANRRPLFPEQSKIVLTTGAVRHAS